MTTATIDNVSETGYAESISAALNTALLRHQVVARVGMRQQDNLLYVALEPLLSEGETEVAATAVDRHPKAAALLPFLQQTLVEVRSHLKLEWVKLTKVSGRLPGQPFPLWQDDILIDSPQAPGDVSVSIGGNLSGQLIIGDNNQAYNYTYNVEHGGVLNVAAPPTIKPRPAPLSVKPRPFKQLLDRQTVLPILRSTLEQVLPVEVFAEPGFGKTTLMRHLAHDEQLTAGFADGVVYLAVHQQEAEDVLQSLYDIFYEASPPFKPSYGQVQQSLRSKQALIILNGLSLKTQEMSRLLDAMPTCGFVLVSEERIYWQDGAAIALEGLPFPESIALIQKELGRALSDAEQVVAKSLWTSLKGNPLQLRRSAAQVQAEEDKKAALSSVVQSAQAATPGPVSQQSLAQLCLNKLSNSQRAALGLMGAMGGVALSAAQAQAISQTPETATALSELAELHLVETTGNGYQICGDLVETVQQSIDPEPWLTKATQYFAHDFVSEGAATAEPGSAEAMLHLMDWTQGTQQWQQSIELAKQLDQPLSTSGQWAQWESVLNNCLQAAEQCGNGNAEAWSLHQLGTRSLALGNAAQADGWLARSLWLREQLGDTAGAAITRHNLGFITPPLVMMEGAPVATSFVEEVAQVADPGLRRLLPWGAAIGGLVLAGAAGLALLPTSEEDASDIPTAVEEVIQPVDVEEPAPNAPLGLTFNPARLAFGETLLIQPNRKLLSISNSGDEPVNIATLELLGQQASSFAVLDKSCGGKTLLPRASCQLEVVFNPKAAGDYTAQLRVQSETGGVRSIVLGGKGKVAAAPTTGETGKPPTPSPPTPEENGNNAAGPSAADDIESVESGSSVVIDVLSNDVVAESDGPLTVVEISEPSAGTATISDGSIVYSHGGEGVRDRFTYTVQDADNNTDTAIVAITVTEPEDTPSPPTDPPEPDPPEPEQQPPSVSDYQIELQAGDSPKDVNLLESATDPNPNDVLRVLRVANNPHEGGELVNNGDGTVTYIPAAPVPPIQTENGLQYIPAYDNSFEFEITDDQGGTAIARLYVRVVNPEPEVEEPYDDAVPVPYDEEIYEDETYEVDTEETEEQELL